MKSIWEYIASWSQFNLRTSYSSVAAFTPGTPSYQTRRGRRPSVYISANGEHYSPSEESWNGDTGNVRVLYSTNSLANPLVVKRLQASAVTSNYEEEENYLLKAYPEKACDIKVFGFSREEQSFRLVMPFFGTKTLYSLLGESGNSLNYRYDHYLKAIAELQRLHANNITHGDTHASNILFNNEGACFFIDGTLSKGNAWLNTGWHQQKDIDSFRDRSITETLWQYEWLSKAILSEEEPITNYRFFVKKNSKGKAIFEYHLIDLKGKPIKNKITLLECQGQVSVEDYAKLSALFLNDNCHHDGTFAACLPIFLELSSRRGETPRHHTTYMSPNFLVSIMRCDTLAQMASVITTEMKINQEVVIKMVQELHEKLLQLVKESYSHASCSSNARTLLQQLETDIQGINTDFEHASSYLETDLVTRNLMHSLYQAERLCSHESWSPWLLHKRVSPLYLAVQPGFDSMREILRCHLPHLPEIPVPVQDILSSKNPLAYESANPQEIGVTAKK